MAHVLIKKGEKQTHGREGNMKMEAELEVMYPPTRELQGLPSLELDRGREGSSPEPSEGAWPGRHLGFRLLVSRTVRELISVASCHHVCGGLLWQP